MRVALAGDVIVTRDLAGDPTPGLADVRGLLRGADVAVANLEMTLVEPPAYGSVAAGGLWMGAGPHRAADLAWLGLRAVSRANNHAADYGPDPVGQTAAALDAAGIAHAGAGPDLPAARAPVVVRTAAGRVALVSCATTFPLHSMAGDPHADVPGRPGISPLRVLTTHVVDHRRFADLVRLAGDLGLGAWSTGAWQPAEVLARLGRSLPDLAADGPHLVLLGGRFVPGDRAEVVEEVLASDAEAVLAAVRQAREAADVVVLAIHAHEGVGDGTRPPEAVAAFARRAVEAGADVVVGHGPHVLRGIEAHEGGVVLHGLGSLVFQPDTVDRLPAEAYHLHDLDERATPADLFRVRWREGRRGFPARPQSWESVIAVVEVDHGTVRAVRLHPVTLGLDRGPGRWGTPVPASEPAAGRILERVARLSAEYATEVDPRTGAVGLPG